MALTPSEKLKKLNELKNPSIQSTHMILDRINSLRGEQGIQGKEGYTPVKGIDYFTQKEIGNFVVHIQSLIRPGPQGEMGIQGLRGIPGETPIRGIDYWTTKDQEKIISDVISKIPKPKDGITPDINLIIQRVSEEYKKNPIEFKDIKGTEKLVEFLKMGGFRGGGGISNITGLINAGTNVTLTGSGTSSDPYVINSAGGGSGSPGGNDKAIQFNDNGSFGGGDFFNWDNANFLMGIGTANPIKTLTVSGNAVIGDSDEFNFANSTRLFNVVGRTAVARVFRFSDDSTVAAPAVELMHSRDFVTLSIPDVWWDFFADTNGFSIRERISGDHVRLHVTTLTGNIGIGTGTTAATAKLQIAGGTTTAGTAPLKINSGAVLSTTEAGAIENDGTHLYYTAANGGTRFQLDQQATTPGGLNTQLQYNNSGAFGGISGATTNGTIVSLTNPVIGGATITTSSVNGVTLTTGGSTSSFLNANGTYTTPAGGVTSVTAADTTLTISPTTGAVIAGLNLANPNVFTTVQSVSTAGIASTSTDGFILQNLTASTVGVTAQRAPRLRLTGTAYNSVSGLSEVDGWIIESLPQTTAGTTSTNIAFSSSINGGAFVQRLLLNSAGALISSATTSTSFQSSSTFLTSDFSTLGNAANTTTQSQLLFAGSTTVNYRVFMNGATAATPAANNSYSGFIIGSQTATIASTGTHVLFAQQVINPLTINSGTGTLTNSASLYINGVATGALNNWGIWQPTGQVLIGPVTAGITAENKLSIIGNANDYHGIYLANLSNGALASQDIVVGNDKTAADLTTFVDFGANSSGNTNVAFTAFGSGDAYLFTSGQINNLNLYTGTVGKSVVIGTGGTLTANERMRVTDTGVVIGGTGLTSKLNVIENALGTTPIDAIVAQNLTAAAAGAQQISPNIHWQGQGWKTTATAASQSVDVIINLLPVQGTTAPSGTLQFMSSIGGAAYANFFVVTTTGGGTFQGPILGGAAASGNVAIGSVNSSNFASYNSNVGATNATAMYQFGGSSSVNFRNVLGGSVSTIAAGVGNNYANTIIASSTLTAAASGTHAILANLVVNPIGTITNTAPVTITNTVSLYVNGAPTGGTNNYAMWVASGISKFDGDVKLGVAGNGLYIKEGSNATMGTGTLTAGTVTVSTTKVTANSRIFLSPGRGTLTNIGIFELSARSAGTSFTITSSNILDTSSFDWVILEPAP